MKKYLFLFFALLTIAARLPAQNGITGNLNAATTTCLVSNSCLILSISQNDGGATIKLSGTWSATVQFEATADPLTVLPTAASWVALSATPSSSSTTATSSTSNGVWQVNVSGYQRIRIRVSAYTSGTIAGAINLSIASARGGSGGGGGGGGGGSITGCSIAGGIIYNNGTANTGTCGSPLITGGSGDIVQTLPTFSTVPNTITSTAAPMGTSVTQAFDTNYDFAYTYTPDGMNLAQIIFFGAASGIPGDIELSSPVGGSASLLDMNVDSLGTVQIAPAVGSQGFNVVVGNEQSSVLNGINSQGPAGSSFFIIEHDTGAAELQATNGTLDEVLDLNADGTVNLRDNFNSHFYTQIAPQDQACVNSFCVPLTTSIPATLTNPLTVISNGTNPGIVSWAGNTAAVNVSANTFAIEGPSTATFTQYGWQVSSTAPTANQIPLLGAPDGTTHLSQLNYVNRVWQGCGSRGLGDGLNAIPSGTYLQFACVNDTGVTVTLTGFRCWTDNAGSSTMSAANNAATALLTGAVTCSATKASGGAAGTQSATTTLASGDAISFTFIADGTSKQTNWTVSGTY